MPPVPPMPPVHFDSMAQSRSTNVPPINNVASGSSERPMRQPAIADDPFSFNAPGWDAPLQNPIPQNVPAVPVFRKNQPRHSRQTHVSLAPNVTIASTSSGHRRIPGPLHDISSSQADPALNNLTRGDIAYREMMSNYNASQQQQALEAFQEQERQRNVAQEQNRQRLAAQQQQGLAAVEQERLRFVAEQQMRQRQERYNQRLAEEQRLAAQQRQRQERYEQILAEQDPEHRPFNHLLAQRILQLWEGQHIADLEEDFNGFAPQDDLELENIHAAFDEMMLHPLEYFEEPMDNMNDFGEQIMNGLGPHNDIPAEDDLENVNPAEHRPEEQLEPLPDNDPLAEQLEPPIIPVIPQIVQQPGLFSLFQEENSLI
ncbi:hypothetical protein H2248_004413 [Termitomyces sp. 'cryptogamus']|nr:hypothetical protein H2248_004413 [Termitomyces sp. 'cryptogamus']